MPIYEYKCRDCGKVFEELVSVGHKGRFPCPACSSKKTDKMMSATGLISVSPGHSLAAPMPCASQCPGAGSCSAGGCCPQSA